MAIKSIWHYFLNKNRNVFSRKSIATGKNKVVVSLTTYNERLDTVYLTLESILNQNVSGYDVYLWLSEEDCTENELPKSLRKLRDRGVKIKFVSENMRSYKKLSYMYNYVMKNKCTYDVIVTADDDILYPQNWLDGFLKKHVTYPNDVLCYRGHDLVCDGEGNFLYNASLNNNTSEDQGSINLLPTGVSGVFYPMTSLNEQVINFNEILKRAKYMDDIWYKGVTSSCGVISRRVYKKNIHFPPIISTLSTGLVKNNVTHNLNDKVINDVFEFFEKLDVK
ncbi:glycosyltransferase family 2 protein [Vibrio sp. PID23_8]|uniref:glycosyltransferase n=1 Tax=Vibrio sp. PID23_8 TaxID=1583767 RepID=UPI001C724E62|nr:glycosyltransferase family 2 protein [Vibrio sp. PID23_8]